jgi:hypothetical protein
LGSLLGPANPPPPAPTGDGSPPPPSTQAPLTSATGGLAAPLVNVAQTALAPVDPVLSPLLTPVAELTQPVMTPLAKTINPALTPLVEPVAQVAQQVVSPINEALDPVLTPLLAPVTQLVGAVVAPVVQAVFDALDPVLVPLLQPVTELTQAVAAKVDQVLSLASVSPVSLTGIPGAFSGPSGTATPPPAAIAMLGSPPRAVGSAGLLAGFGPETTFGSPSSSSSPWAPRPASPDPAGRGADSGSIRNSAPQPLAPGLLIAALAVFLLGVVRPDTLRSLRPTRLPYLVIQPG